MEKVRENSWRLWLFIFAILGINTAILSTFWAFKLIAPHMLDWGELEVLNAVYWWKRGFIPPYSSLDQIPAFANHYGPIYEGICAILPSFVHPYFTGRILSLLATLSILFTVALWVFYKTKNWSYSLLAVMLLLTAKPLFTFGIVHRVDALAVGFSAIGFALVLLTRHWLKVGLGVALMALGFHTKLTAVAAPIACIIALWREERRKALLVGGSWLLMAAVGLGILQIISDGNYLRHASLGNEPSEWLKPFDMITRPLTSSPFWVALAFYSWRITNACKSYAFKPELSYLAAALFIAGITATNPGSSWNYLLDFYVALAMLTGRLIWLAIQKDTARNAVVSLLIAHALFAVLHTGYFNAKDIAKVQTYRREFLDAKAKLGDIFANSHRIAILGSGSAVDVALSYGLPNYIDLPSKMRRYAEELAINALRKGQLDLVVIAKEKLEVITREKIGRIKVKCLIQLDG
ncbi:MAG: hypothetical protein N2381_09295 [Armatimonadetes bacterium]|nr:hypothetical protein [Armatimonadota bacterium]